MDIRRKRRHEYESDGNDENRRRIRNETTGGGGGASEEDTTLSICNLSFRCLLNIDMDISHNWVRPRTTQPKTLKVMFQVWGQTSFDAAHVPTPHDASAHKVDVVTGIGASYVGSVIGHGIRV